jgi:hypothetical protein
MLHLLLHFSVPAIVVGFFFRQHWQRAYGVMIVTMVVDLDHLLANPIYDAARCSIGFHPLHQPSLMVGYFALCFFTKTRFIGIGLIIQMILDSIDCQITNGVWMHAV